MTVDDELAVFEQSLRDELEFQLTVHVNMRKWEAMDYLDNHEWENINATIRDVFAPWLRQYGYTSVAPILQDCRNTLVYVVWTAMDVPYPRNPLEHIRRVIDNTINVYVRRTYAELRTEMVMANHYAHVIQRNWRRAISDPSYLVCQRRLENEFKKISGELDMYGDIFRLQSRLQAHVQS